MKMTTTLKHIAQDRTTVILWGVSVLVALITAIIAGFQVRPSELNIPTRYTAFGVTDLYSDAWYYLLGFFAFLVIALILHSLIALKLYTLKGVAMARLFMSITVIMMVAASFYVTAIIGVAALLR